ncbi:MAG TPA: PAS domain S-box protein, partial [Pyrinomonadaceae bacterium]|nr:PAS domain S-box protein [Pyrinomonadaceae bacterium]
MKPLLPAIDLSVFQRLCEGGGDDTSRNPESYSQGQRTLLTLMSNLPGMAYCCRNDEHWTMLFVSEGCTELTGYQPADLVGNQKISYASLIHEDDREALWREVQAAVAARCRFRLVYRLKSAQGEKWVWEQGHGVFSPGGELLALEGFVTDITDRVQSEQALREAELKYRSIFENAVHGIYRSTLDGQFLAVNPAMARMLGYDSPEDLIANCKDIAREFYVDAGSREEFKSLLEARGTVEGFEAQAFCKDRRVIWMRENVYAVRDTAGALLYYEGSVEDITERKQTARALAESEERHRAFVEQSSEAIWMFELERPLAVTLPEDEQVEHIYKYGYLAECNDVMAQMYGHTRASEILGVRPGMTTGGDNARHRESTRAFVRSGYRLSDEESEELNSQGERKTFLNNLVGIVEDGRLLRIWGTQRDITARKRAEQALRESEERYRDLFENATDLIYTTDLTGHYVSVNPVVEKITGYTCEEICRMHFSELLAPGGVERARQMLERKLSGDEATTFYETEIVAKNGEHVLLEVSTQLIYDDGVAVGVQGIARDIRERKRAERALREGEERYRELFENANDIVYTHDLAGNFTSLNKTGERVTGYTREEAAKLNMAEVVAPEYLARSREMLGRKEFVAEATVYELEIIAKDGRRVPLEVSTRLIYENGHPCGVQGIARDITERKHTEAKLLHNAYHDALTGLPNRNLFTDHLQKAVERA